MAKPLSAIGIDIGGTNIKLGLVSARGRMLHREHLATRDFPGRFAMLNELVRRIASLRITATRKNFRVTGVGIGAPGPINVEKGSVYFLPNIRGWKNVALRSVLRRRLGIPVFVDNDANAMAFGEFLFGAGRGAKSLIGLTLGTGVGGGIVLDGKLFHGHAYSAAEVGHVTINENGPRCACGSRGCVETYVGNRYFILEVLRRLKKARRGLLYRWVVSGARLTPELVEKAARKGDALSRQMWKETGEHLGTALAGLVNVLNPERIVVGGGVAKAGAFIFRPLQKTLQKKAFPIAVASVRVLPATLGTDAGVIGAAALALAGRS